MLRLHIWPQPINALKSVDVQFRDQFRITRWDRRLGNVTRVMITNGLRFARFVEVPVSTRILIFGLRPVARTIAVVPAVWGKVLSYVLTIGAGSIQVEANHSEEQCWLSIEK